MGTGADIAAPSALEARLKSGSAWFYWIAALSAVNSLVVLTGREWAFIIGLGVTQIIDALGLAAAQQIGPLGKIVALLDLVPVGLFVFFGYFAGRRHAWAFLTGSILYALDGLVFLLVGDWLSLGFHVFALAGIYGGWKACRELEARPTALPPPLAAMPSLSTVLPTAPRHPPPVPVRRASPLAGAAR